MNISTNLHKARTFEEKHRKNFLKESKPIYHLSSPIGWINDPNGFSEFNKEYHLFYQYHPYSKHWGPMHWGHSKTKDFIRWEQLPAAMAPDTDYDMQGCFSGSAIEVDNKHILMYTGVMDQVDVDGSRSSRQTQCIAIGDGMNYEKLDNNPVIIGDMLPEGSSMEDFRDPKMWKEDGIFYAVVGNRSADGSGQIALFQSYNISDWEFVTIIAHNNNEFGKMWECPDFFALDGKQVMLTSPQEMCAKGYEYHNGNGTLCLIGDYDKQAHTYTREYSQAIDYGLDFYAPQTLLSSDGRRIMIGWMHNWENDMTPKEFDWSGMMTIPRELYIRDGKLIQNPIREIKSYYEDTIEYKEVKVDKKIALKGIEGRELDMTVDLIETNCEKFNIFVAQDEEYQTLISFEPSKGLLTFDRNYSGTTQDTIYMRKMSVNNRDGKITLRILLDKYSVEIFANDGEQAMTSVIFTPVKVKGITFCTEGGSAKMSIIKHSIIIK